MRTSLKLAIITADRTQRAVSIASQIPETRLSEIVRGRTRPTADERARLAAVLNSTPEVLFPAEASAPRG